MEYYIVPASAVRARRRNGIPFQPYEQTEEPHDVYVGEGPPPATIPGIRRGDHYLDITTGTYYLWEG